MSSSPQSPSAGGDFYSIHGSKLREKFAANSSDSSLAEVVMAYDVWCRDSAEVESRSDDDITRLVDYLNDYKDSVEPLLDSRPNSAQEVLQPSIIEEFMSFLFAPLQRLNPNLIRQPDRGYLSLVFHPTDVNNLVDRPEFTISRKDHDFIIGSSVLLSITGSDGSPVESRIVVPAVAIECKRYLERNMLDECAGTAARIKRATPYCLYLVVAEYLKMDNARPELSKIDEIYILRKQRNSERLDKDFRAKPIDPVLVIDLYRMVERHLSRVWWDPQSALTRGKVFDR